MKYVTFRNLYDYIQDAEVTKFGYHYPFKNHAWFFHIYASKRQVNIDNNGMPGAVFLFDPEQDKVTMVHVSKYGVASYSDPSKKCTISMDAAMWEGNWDIFDGVTDGGTIKSVVLDAISPYVAEKEGSNESNTNVRSASPVDVAMTYYGLNAAINELNSINANYTRHSGSLVMACKDTEDRIEAVCSRIMSAINTLRQPGYLDCVENRDEINMTIPVVEEIVRTNLEEVAKSREFLATYYW